MRGNINYHYLFFYCVLLCFIVILIEHYVFKSSMFVLPYYNKRMYVCMYVCITVILTHIKDIINEY